MARLIRPPEVTTMKEPRTRPSGTRRQRCARWLGLEHNPLRRPADRIEAWLRLLALAVALTAVPLMAIGIGLFANQVMAHRAQAQQRSDRVVSAVLIQRAPIDASDPYIAAPLVWAKARWTAPDGAARSGDILAPAGTPAGRTVRIWVNRAGVNVDPPVGHQDVMTGSIMIGVSSGLTLILLLMGLQALARRALDRQRLAAWDSEWRATGPLWTNHRS